MEGLVDDISDIPSSWLLWGDVGVGKTGLAAAFQRTLMFDDEPDDFPVDSRFISVPALFTKLRAAISDPESSEA